MTILGLLLLATLGLWVARRRLPALDTWMVVLLDPRGPHQAYSARSDRGWTLAGLGFVCLCFAWLEIREPYYFTQADVLATELPGVLSGYRSLWSGSFPDFDPFPFLGSPLASLGVYSLTYPVQILAYALARHVLADETLTMEVLAALHLAGGFLATRWAARQADAGPMTATLGSLAFVLSGVMLISGRSWHMFLPFAVWPPLMAGLLLRLCKGPATWRWPVAFGASLGILYHVGFSPMWVYTVAFLGLAFAGFLACRALPLRRASWLVPAGLLAAALAVPLIRVQADAVSDLVRQGGNGNGVHDGLVSMLLPWPLAEASLPNGWGNVPDPFNGHFYYSGTLVVGLLILAIPAVLSSGPRTWLRSPWPLLALLALWVALGTEGTLGDLPLKVPLLHALSSEPLLNLLFGAAFGALAWLRRRRNRNAGWWGLLAFLSVAPLAFRLDSAWALLLRIPVFGPMNNHPFRLLAFFVLFAVLGTLPILERVLARLRHRLPWELGIALAGSGLLLFHVDLCRASFYTFGYRPYPDLPPAMDALLRPPGPGGRIASWAPQDSPAADFGLSLAGRLPAVYGIPAFHGYDPIVEYCGPFSAAADRFRADPPAAARAYGIRWVLEHRTIDRPEFSPNPGVHAVESVVPFGESLATLVSRSKATLELPELTVWETGSPDPLAFPSGHPDTSLPLSLDGGGIHLSTAAPLPPGPLVVNFLWYPRTRAMSGGTELPVRPDEWGRIVVDVPAGVSAVDVGYHAPWSEGLAMGAGLLLAAILAVPGARRLCAGRPAGREVESRA